MSLINKIDHLLGGTLSESQSIDEAIFNGENIASEENIESALKVSEGLEVYASLLLKYIAKFESALPSGLATKVKKLLDDPEKGFDYSLDAEGKKELATLWKELQKVDKFFASTFFCEIFTEVNFHSMCKLIKTEWIAKTRISSNESKEEPTDEEVSVIEDTLEEYTTFADALSELHETLQSFPFEGASYALRDTAKGFKVKVGNGQPQRPVREIPQDEINASKAIYEMIEDAVGTLAQAGIKLESLMKLIKPRVDQAEKDYKDLDL